MEIKICAKCECCWESEDEPDNKSREPCPDCDSIGRKFTVHAQDGVGLRESVGGKVKDPTLPSKKKVRVEFFDGFDWSVLLEKDVQKSVLRDKRDDRYYEKVIDPDTGETIHKCDEPLSEHRGHGSAKFKKKP